MQAGGYSWLPKHEAVPSLSLIEEYKTCGAWLRSEQFSAQLNNRETREDFVWTPMLDWHGDTPGLITLLVQRQFLCLEAHMCAAVRRHLLFSDLLPRDERKAYRVYANDPFLLNVPKGEPSGTVERLFHHLPRLLHPELTARSDAELWPKLKAVYKHVRNPIMHGSRLNVQDPKDVFPVLDVLDEVFEWIQMWDIPMPTIPKSLAVRTADTGNFVIFELLTRGPRNPPE